MKDEGRWKKNLEDCRVVEEGRTAKNDWTMDMPRIMFENDSGAESSEVRKKCKIIG
jgi:hypothetical protein